MFSTPSRFMLIIIFVFPLFCKYITASDRFSVVELPNGFEVLNNKKCFNIHGQVIGAIAKDKSNFYEYGKEWQAAAWDLQQGLTLIDIQDNSIARAINDSGIVCVEHQKPARDKVTLLWNIHTGEITFGPLGTPYAINNLNDVLIKPNPSDCNDVVVWNSSDRTLVFHSPYAIDINNKREFCSYFMKNRTYSIAFNDIGNVLCYRDNQIFLYANEKNYPVIFPKEQVEHARNVCLNNYDEVFSLVYTNSIRSEICIAKWTKEGKTVFSHVLNNRAEFNGHKFFELIQVNDVGQLLIRAHGINTKRIFLLTPDS